MHAIHGLFGNNIGEERNWCRAGAPLGKRAVETRRQNDCSDQQGERVTPKNSGCLLLRVKLNARGGGGWRIIKRGACKYSHWLADTKILSTLRWKHRGGDFNLGGCGHREAAACNLFCYLLVNADPVTFQRRSSSFISCHNTIAGRNT